MLNYCYINACSSSSVPGNRKRFVRGLMAYGYRHQMMDLSRSGY